jgi:hypothetical protein
VLFVQDALEQGGFAAAEKAGQDGDWDHVGRLYVRESVRNRIYRANLQREMCSECVCESGLPGAAA